MATLYYHNLHFPSLCATCDVTKLHVDVSVYMRIVFQDSFPLLG